MVKNRHLALCEIDILRAMLTKQGINIFDSAQIDRAITSLEISLAIAGIIDSDSSLILKQVKTSYAVSLSENTQTLFPFQQNSSTSSLALHHAARSGDLATVKKLVASGSSVNAKDLFSATPLHMAAMYGHKSVAEFLLNHGAEINAKTQKLTDVIFTPLDLAAQYAPNTEIVAYLLNKGAQPEHWDILVAGLFDIVMESSDKKDYKAFDLALSKMEMISQNKNALWVYSENEVKPVLVLYKVLATEVCDVKFYERIMKTLEHLISADKTLIAERYILAKNLLHSFPSDEIYTYKIGPNTVKLAASGYYDLFAVGLAAQTLAAFEQSQDASINLDTYQAMKTLYPENKTILQTLDSYEGIKLQLFKTVENIFNQAYDTALKAGLFETSKALFNDYENGKTIILPCGWDGHAIEIILDKELNLFVIANAGERFEGFSPGLNAFNMQFSITPEIIHSILTNQDQLALEFKKFYDLGLERNENYSIIMPEQHFGNCAWNSQVIAQKGLLYIELFKLTANPELSLSLADEWFDEYSDFHLTYVLKAYVEDPFLEEAALGDILLSYHANLASPSEIERAQLLLDVLSENTHKKAFSSYLQEHIDELTPEIKQYLTDHGFAVSDQWLMGSEASNAMPIVLSDVLNLSEVEFQHENHLMPAQPLPLLLPVLVINDEPSLNVM